jgi:ParB-like chromosome segregation protein Spo0J
MRTVRIEDIDVSGRFRTHLGNVDELAASIADVGLMHPPVVTPDLKLVAGARRLAAMKRLGWTETEVRFADNLDDALSLLKAERDENICRAEMPPLDRINLGKAIEAVEKPKAQERQISQLKQGEEQPRAGNFPEREKGETRDRVGEAVGWSGKTYQKAAAVAEAAEEDPETFGELAQKMNTTGKVDGAYREVKQIKRQIEVKEKAAEVAQRTDRYRLLHRDISELAADLDPDSVDVIITDPPYPQEYLWTFGALAELAAKVLKPGGSVLAMSGQTYLPEVMAAMQEHLTYHWTIAYMTPGSHYQAHHRRVLCAWKPVLWFVKGEYTGQTRYDVARSEARDKDHHHWGQSESGFADLIEQFTDPGEVVLDPFVGGGTTGVVAVRLNRLFIGADAEETAITTSAVRLSEEVAA